MQISQVRPQRREERIELWPLENIASRINTVGVHYDEIILKLSKVDRYLPELGHFSVRANTVIYEINGKKYALLRELVIQ